MESPREDRIIEILSKREFCLYADFTPARTETIRERKMEGMIIRRELGKG